jgi:hypothetical protein
MAKKYRAQQTSTVSRQPQPVIESEPAKETPKVNYKDYRSWLYDFKPQAIIVALLALVVYLNSFSNEFAHDDGIVIVKNEYVLEGFAGISKILTKDAYDSYYRQLNTTNQLEGGRYRPLSIITFAIEQQFMGPVPVEGVDSVLKKTIAYGVAGPEQQKLVGEMHVRHVINVLWYILSVITLLYFLRYIVFKNNTLMALVATIIFTVHPIHTEVVANVKSRDEIMSLLFMCLTFIFAFKYEENRNDFKMLIAALVSYFLAFLSKEYAITMLALLPLSFYIFRQYSISKSIAATIPYLVVITVYFCLRINVLAPLDDAMDSDSANSPVLTLFPKLAAIAAIAAFFFYIRSAKKLVPDRKLFGQTVLQFLPYLAIISVYLLIRKQAIPPVTASAAKEVLNNPYLFAEGNQKIATEIATSLNYLKLLVFPHPLSADYSYATIAYKDFSHPLVWLSLLVHIGLLVMMVAFFPIRRALPAIPSVTQGRMESAGGRGIICFAIAFYLIHLLLVCNIIFDIGATMGERLIYHSSVGFAIAVAYLLVKGFEKIQPETTRIKALAGVVGVIVILFSIKTIARNADWKNDNTLFTQDLKTVPNSVLVNANVAASYITIADLQKNEKDRLRYLNESIKILDHTLQLHRTFVAGYLNRGIAWFKLGEVDKAKANIDSVRKLYPTYPTLPGMYKLISDHYLRNGWESYGKHGMYAQAVEEYKKGLSIDSFNVDLWYNMGGAYYTNKQFPEAANSFQMALRLQPNNVQAQQGLMAAQAGLNGVAQQAQQQARSGQKK